MTEVAVLCCLHRGLARLLWWLGGLLTAQELLSELAPPDLMPDQCALNLLLSVLILAVTEPAQWSSFCFVTSMSTAGAAVEGGAPQLCPSTSKFGSIIEMFLAAGPVRRALSQPRAVPGS